MNSPPPIPPVPWEPITPSEPIQLSSANVATYFTVVNASYTFSSGAGTVFKPSNLGVNSSTARLDLTSKWATTLTIKIDYNIKTEASYDKFTINANGTANPANISGTKSGSITVSIPPGALLRLKYVKDSSNSASGEKVDVTMTFVP